MSSGSAIYSRGRVLEEATASEGGGAALREEA